MMMLGTTGPISSICCALADFLNRSRTSSEHYHCNRETSLQIQFDMYKMNYLVSRNVERMRDNPGREKKIRTLSCKVSKEIVVDVKLCFA